MKSKLSDCKYSNTLRAIIFSAKITSIGAGIGSIPYLYLNNDFITLRSIAIIFVVLFITNAIENRKER